MSGEFKCACKSSDARQCFLIRHPECRRKSDVDDAYDRSIDEECECSCHEPDQEFYEQFYDFESEYEG